MSDYTIAVDWSGKDALSDSDSAKVISGSDFNTEFTTIRTAANSKANIASPTLTGTPAAPTAVADTNTTQIATTAFVTAADAVLTTALAPKASPTFTGTPAAPTAATSTNTTQVATTAMVQAAIDADVTVHAALRSASGTYGHAQIYVTDGDLYIVTT